MMNDFLERIFLELHTRCLQLGARVQELEKEIEQLKTGYASLVQSSETTRKEYESLLSLVINNT